MSSRKINFYVLGKGDVKEDDPNTSMETTTKILDSDISDDDHKPWSEEESDTEDTVNANFECEAVVLTPKRSAKRKSTQKESSKSKERKLVKTLHTPKKSAQLKKPKIHKLGVNKKTSQEKLSTNKETLNKKTEPKLNTNNVGTTKRNRPKPAWLDDYI